MVDYQRILSYLYRYEKAEKKECLGFVKAEQKSGNLKLTVQIEDERLLQGMKLKLCFYEKQGESWQVWQLDTLITQEQKEEMHLMYPITVLPGGFRIKGQSGVLLYYQDTFYYGSVWIGEEIPTEVLNPLRWHKVVSSAKAENVTEKEWPKEEISSKKENILEENNLVNVENFKKEENSEKDFEEKPQGEPESERTDQALEEGLSDVESSIAVENEEIIEENIAMKEFPAENTESGSKSEEEQEPELKPESERKAGLESEPEPEARRKAELESEPKPEVEIKAEAESEPELKIKSTLELAAKEEESVDNFEKVWINSTKKKPAVDNIFNTAFYEGHRVLIADLAQFGKEAGELKSNQFLLKGYERYHHILAGKVRYAGKKRYCIGVPGIYENREKYMAEIYQFPVFLSLTENRMKTGSFGYWLHLLSEVE